MIRHKIEQKTGAPGAQNKMLIPCLGSLYGIDCRETAVVDPEIFKSRLHDAIKTVFRTHAERSPTVICLEDIHWADPSSTELIHTLCFDPGYPALFIFTLRPTFTLKLEQKPGSPESHALKNGDLKFTGEPSKGGEKKEAQGEGKGKGKGKGK